MSEKSLFVVVAATLLQLAIVGWVLAQTLSIIPVSYPIELKLLVVASFILVGITLSFGRRDVLASLTLIFFWWLTYVLLFVSNDFGVTNPAGDGAKATVILLFGWLLPTMIVLCKLLIQFWLSRHSPQVHLSYIIDEEGKYWKFTSWKNFLQDIEREKRRTGSVYIRMPTSLACEETTASRDGLSRMKSLLERFRMPTFEIRENNKKSINPLAN